MSGIVYYNAANSTGTSAKIIARLKEKLGPALLARNIFDNPDLAELESHTWVIFLVATYGDQELNDEFERFLLKTGELVAGKVFSVCELGNYYGYDDFAFGSGDIVITYLTKNGAKQVGKLVSIDTLPKLDWNAVENWLKIIQETNESLGNE